MNYNKAVKIALAQNEKNQVWLADKMAVSRSYVSAMLNGEKSPTLRFMSHAALALDMKLSDLIALGEE